MTTIFYYFSVNDHYGLPRNSFSKYTCITSIHHDVPQNFRFYLRYVYEGFIGEKVMKLWRQESWPFCPGWAAELWGICSLTCRGRIAFFLFHFPVSDFFHHSNENSELCSMNLKQKQDNNNHKQLEILQMICLNQKPQNCVNLPTFTQFVQV